MNSSRGRDKLPKTTSVVLLGKGELAIRALYWLHTSSLYEIVSVVPVKEEPDWTPYLGMHAVNLSISDPGMIAITHDFRAAPCADLALSVFYDRILPPDWIARYGRVLNLHNAPLPAYRGVNPINWALKNGETSHGVTLHEVTAGIDDGPIVAQTTFPIWPATDEVEDVYRRSLAFGWTLLEAVLPLLGSIEAVAQDESKASYYARSDAVRLGDRAGWRRP